MSRSRPAASASAVRWRSSGDGVGSPDGWLWTRIRPRGVQPDGVAEQLADADERRRDVALVDGRDPEHDVLRVQEHDPQLLPLEAAHLEQQPVGDVARRADRPAAGRPVGQQPPAELERGDQLGGLRRADARAGRRARRPSPGRDRSARHAAPARPRRGRPPTGRARRSPTAARSAPRPRGRRRRAARAARGAARRLAARGSPGRRSSATSDRRRVGRKHACGDGRPRARTTEARRFLPPSGPGNAANPSGRPSPAGHPEMHRDCAGRPRPAAGSGALSPSPSRRSPRARPGRGGRR